MPGGVEHCQCVVFIFGVLEQEGDGFGFDGDVAILLIYSAVHPSMILFEVPLPYMCLLN